MKLPDVGIKLPDVPRKVVISVVILVASAALYGVLLGTLAATLDQAIAQNKKLQLDLTQDGKTTSQARADYKFATENQEKFEAVLQSDRLIPHTRRDAATKLQAIALQDGVTSLTWQFGDGGAPTPGAAPTQVKQTGYRLNAESIGLRIGAPLDGLIYKFLLDVDGGLPGTVVLSSVSLTRPERLTSDAVERVGQVGSAGLVVGEVTLLWRTAQAIDAEKKAP